LERDRELTDRGDMAKRAEKRGTDCRTSKSLMMTMYG